jgi:hypothetical protein
MLLIVAGAVALAAVAALVALLLLRAPAGSVDDGAGAGAREHLVTYKVAATILRVNLAYGQNERENDVWVPWEKTVVVEGKSALYLWASLGDSPGGRVFCEIWVDGVLVDRQNTRGPGAETVCEGSTE